MDKLFKTLLELKNIQNSLTKAIIHHDNNETSMLFFSQHSIMHEMCQSYISISLVISNLEEYLCNLTNKEKQYIPSPSEITFSRSGEGDESVEEIATSEIKTEFTL